MKKTIILLLLSTQSIFSQNVINLIYVDNHETLNKFEEIQNNLDEIIDNNFLLYISDGDDPSIFTDTANYTEKIKATLLKQTERPSIKMDVRYLNHQITKHFDGVIKLGEGVNENTKVNLYFFFDMSTFCGYDLHQDFVNNLLLFYKLRTKEGINNNCKITYYIHENSDECKLPTDKQITIKKY